MNEREPLPPRRSEAEPSKTPHLHVRTVEGLMFGEAIAITGNARALLKLRAQIDRALRNETSHPFEECVYQDVNGIPFEVAVKRARSKDEMGEPVPKPERTAEQLPWSTEGQGDGRGGARRGRRGVGSRSLRRRGFGPIVARDGGGCHHTASLTPVGYVPGLCRRVSTFKRAPRGR